jgi:hypothetical protein
LALGFGSSGLSASMSNTLSTQARTMQLCEKELACGACVQESYCHASSRRVLQRMREHLGSSALCVAQSDLQLNLGFAGWQRERRRVQSTPTEAKVAGQNGEIGRCGSKGRGQGVGAHTAISATKNSSQNNRFAKRVRCKLAFGCTQPLTMAMATTANRTPWALQGRPLKAAK